MEATIAKLNDHQQVFGELQQRLNQQVLGQPRLILRMLIALLADGHLLVEGAPGLAKTRAIKCLAEQLEGDFHRIQFTPDLLPADLTGTDIFNINDGRFTFQSGPLFHNFLLADEINRAPAKVQSALLEAMAERQITVGKTTYQLPELFLVMATQNPIEQEGTFPLPEAQLDRFLMFSKISYPNAQAEREILALNRREASHVADTPTSLLTQSLIKAARLEVLNLHMSDAIENYIVHLVMATRAPQKYSEELVSWLRFGASPRATISLDRCARAHAWLHGRDYVSPEDVQAIAHDVLRHRLILSYEAQAEGATTDHFITALIERIPVS